MQTVKRPTPINASVAIKKILLLYCIATIRGQHYTEDSAISPQDSERHLAFIAEVTTVGYELSTGNIVHNLRVFSKSRALSLL